MKKRFKKRIIELCIFIGLIGNPFFVMAETNSEITEEPNAEEIVLEGWQYCEGEGWYFYENGKKCVEGWKYIDKKWYYLDPNNSEHPGLMVSGTSKEINGTVYGFEDSGRMVEGWFYQLEGWYYHRKGGARERGWLDLGGTWYFLDPNNSEHPGLMVSGTSKEINGTVYGFEDSGRMAEGWFYQSEGWYYHRKGGARERGWLDLGGIWYYLDPNTGVMINDLWHPINGKWYSFHESGAMRTGWLYADGKWYYLGLDGAMKTGWQFVDGLKYYFYRSCDPNGGIHGEMAANVIIDGIKIDESGSAATARKTLDQIYDIGGISFWNTSYNISSGRRDELNTAIKAFTDKGWEVSFVLVDIRTGQAVAYNPTSGIYSASAIKGPYVMSVLNAGYSPTSKMYHTIKWSSNSDYISIRRTYGSGVFSDFLSNAGVSRSQATYNYPKTTSLDLSKMWLQGYYTLFSINGDKSDWARSTFEKVSNSPISASLSPYYTVYSKAGWIAEGGYYNVHTDGAIVMDGNTPYILSIMSTAPGTGGASQMQKLAYQLDWVHTEMMNK